MAMLPLDEASRQDDLYKGILDAPIGFMLSKKSSDEIVEANVMACEMLQRPLTELKGRKVCQIFSLPHQRPVANMLEFAHLNHLVEVAGIINAKVSTGNTVSVSVICKEISGTEPLVCTIFWNATIDASTEVMNHSPAFMGTLSLNGQVLFASTASKALFGIEPQKMHNQQLQSYLHPDDRVLLDQCLKKIEAGDGVASGALRIVNTQGEVIFCPVTLISEIDSTNRPSKVFITAYDNTQVRQQRSREVSQIYDSSKASLAGVASSLHSMNETCLQLIQKMNYLSTRPHSPTSTRMLEESQALTRGLSKDILAIRDKSRVVEKNIQLHRVLFDLKKLLEEVTLPFQESIKQKSLQFLLEIDPRLSRHFYADAAKIKELLAYIISNSVTYTEERGKICLRVAFVEEKLDYDTLTFEVEDTGIPIPETAQKSLFQSHIQTDLLSARTTREAGKLLNLCRAIVHILAGTFGLSSDQKCGAKIYFTLRVQRGELFESPEPIFAGPTGVFKSLKLRALVVDDMAVNTRISSQILQNLGALEVKTAMNGQEALEMYKRDGADIIFMDIQMPIMDGYDAVRQIREFEQFSDKHARIYFSSGTQITHELAIIAGADGRINKPFQVEEFFNVLSRLCC